ncbi:AAA family ATPase [Paracoccus jeotgali]
MFNLPIIIENYRCLKKADVTFNDRMNVIVGRNECGKSTCSKRSA